MSTSSSENWPLMSISGQCLSSRSLDLAYRVAHPQEVTELHLVSISRWTLTYHALSGLIYRAMGKWARHLSVVFTFNGSAGFPMDFFPVLFVVPRVVGWLAHWRQVRILKPWQNTPAENADQFLSAR
jgi:hypothetical protein